MSDLARLWQELWCGPPAATMYSGSLYNFPIRLYAHGACAGVQQWSGWRLCLAFQQLVWRPGPLRGAAACPTQPRPGTPPLL